MGCFCAGDTRTISDDDDGGCDVHIDPEASRHMPSAADAHRKRSFLRRLVGKHFRPEDESPQPEADADGEDTAIHGCLLHRPRRRRRRFALRRFLWSSSGKKVRFDDHVVTMRTRTWSSSAESMKAFALCAVDDDYLCKNDGMVSLGPANRCEWGE